MNDRLSEEELAVVFGKADREADIELDGPEFLELMAARGLIIPRPPTLGERVFHTLGTPWRGLKKVATWFSWRLWGKRMFERNVANQIKRWNQLAGFERSQQSYTEDAKRQYAQKMAILEGKPRTPGAAEALHREIIKSKIVKVELPKPDYDDHGSN